MNQITVANPGRPLYRTRTTTVSAMENRIEFETIVVAVCVAGYAACMLDYVAHVDLGYSCAQIRAVAMIAAILVAIPVATDLLRAKPNKAG